MTRFKLSRRALLAGGTGMAGILATGRAPAVAQTPPKKLVFAHINAAPESALGLMISSFPSCGRLLSPSVDGGG